MAIQPKTLNVTLTDNPNLKTTINTKTHIGVLDVNEPKNYQARSVGIKGDKGSIGEAGIQGIDGVQGEIGLNYVGLFSNIITYKKNDAVSYNGGLYIYTNETPSVGHYPTDSVYWDIIVAQGETGPPGASDELYAQYTKDPTGFVDRVDSKMAFDGATRTFTIEPAVNGGEYIYFVEGIQYTINIPITIQLPDIQQTYFVFFDLAGNIEFTTEFPTTGIVATIALIYWDVDEQTATLFGEERHGISMDWQTHYYLHETIGCQWAHGLDITYIPNGLGDTNDEVKIALSNGVIYDEDLRHSIVNGIVDDLFVQKLTPAAQLPVWFRLGSEGYLKRVVATDYPFKMGVNNIEYNNYNDTTLEWELLETSNNKYMAMWVFATNDIHNPIISVMGQYTDVTLEKAMAANTIDTLNMGDEFITPEYKVLYRIIYFIKDSFTNTFNATISAVTDYRTSFDKTTAGVITVPELPIGDKNYEHIQSIPQSTWYVIHGLEKFPSVFVIDSLGNEVYCDIHQQDHNTIILNFSEPFYGIAYCN